jgi:histidinol-phosphate aminotransferase
VSAPAFRPNRATAALKAYDPGHDLPALRIAHAGRITELGSNENSDGPSPRVLAALREAAADEVWRYPDPQAMALRRALAQAHGVGVDEIVLGNGSHEILMLLAQCFAEAGDEVLFSQFGFAVFPIATAAAGATPVAAPALPMDAGMPRGHDIGALAARVGARTRLVYVANPNNPTGTSVAIEDLVPLLESVPADVPVVIDEAYVEYTDAPRGALDLRARNPNIVVTRTFSKAWGLAGLRVGYAIADAGVIAIVNRLRESFNINAHAQLAACAALGDPAWMETTVAACRARRDALAAALRGRGLFVHPSATNFLLVDFGRAAAPVEAGLMTRRVIVRPMGGYGLPTCLRISVGNEAENAAFLAALDEVLA